jgi:ABC-type multidrug transport system fused ATPase/permease subunit
MDFRVRHLLNKSTILVCFDILDKKDKKKAIFFSVIQSLLSILDLVGVALIGIAGAIAARGLSFNKPGERVYKFLQVINIENYSFQAQVTIIGFSAIIVLAVKTLLSAYITYKSLGFLGRKSAQLTYILLNKLLTQSVLSINQKSDSQRLYALTEGARAVTLEIIGTFIVLISDISLLIIMAVGLLYVDTAMAVIIFSLFGLLGVILYKLMHSRAVKYGTDYSNYSIKGNEKILEVLGSYRENFVRNKRLYYAEEIQKIRSKASIASAELQFLPNLSKYVIEISIVFGSLVMGAAQFALQDSSRAVANLLVFMAAGTRIAPAILRVQQGLIGIKSGLGRAQPTLELFTLLNGKESLTEEDNILGFDHYEFTPDIDVNSVSFRYSENSNYAIKDISFKVESGQTVAIVGASGSGKSTLIDILLGVLTPESGEILISGIQPAEAIKKWPGSIGYVPQETFILNGSIEDNIKMGFDLVPNEISLINNCLLLSHLSDFVESLPQGTKTYVGDKGVKISGGQKQRLGIARALFTNPKLLVLDEATSSLDGKTESDITDSIKELKGSVTVILIAHRLSSIRYADKVIYIDKGKIVAEGTFEEVRKKAPDFDKQAELMGL